MVDYKKMCDSIDNTLTNENIQKIIDNYANGCTLYESLIIVNSSYKKDIGKYNSKARDKLVVKLFNIWKTNFLNITDSEIKKLISKNAEIGKDFYNLREYLKTVPNIKTEKEYKKLVGNSELLDKYGWQKFGESSGWNHVSSCVLSVQKTKPIKVEHRLYLNVESKIVDLMALYFMDKCIERKIPYYFKYDDECDRDDSFVIYSDTEHLGDFIEILREIKKEHPLLRNSIYLPPVLTGKIDNWIGYGSEPKPLPNGKLRSFNVIRTNIINDALKDEFYPYIAKNQDSLVSYKSHKITLLEYIANLVTDIVFNDYESYYRDYPNGNEEFYRRFGLHFEDFNNIKVKEYVTKKVADEIKKIINDSNSNKEEFNTIKIPIKNGKSIDVYNEDIKNGFKKCANMLAKQDKNFLESLTANIKEKSKAEGIDTEKFCFDIDKKDLLIKYSQQSKDNKNVSQNTQSQQSDNGIITKENICQRISPTLLAKKLRLPNGVETTAEQYIKEYFYQYIPEDGFFTLKNGTRMAYPQYISEYIICDGQQKYNGDAIRILEATTRNNLYIIIVNNGKDEIIFSPQEVIHYLNPSLISKEITLPNGVKLSAEKFIQQYFAPYIPENGCIILKNNVVVSIKQFIENVLLTEGITTYQCDIARLMEAKTKNNRGKISLNYEREYNHRQQIQDKANHFYNGRYHK